MKWKSHKEFIKNNDTAFASWNRLEIFGKEYQKYKSKQKKPLEILDIGCGKNVYLYKYKRKDDKYYGCDFYNKINKKIFSYKRIDLNEESLSNLYKGRKFDVIFCGEVIEHLFSPDDLLDEIRKLMHKDSILIFSTPNLSYWVNRILLLFGISPLFMENSSYYKLGRKTSALGQMNHTEGHIRVFTYGALRDLLRLKDFKIEKITPVSIWEIWPDKIVNKLSKSLASDNVFVLKK